MPGSIEKHQKAILILLCVVDFMIALDFSIVNVALPSIKEVFDFSPATLQWVVSAYALTFGGFLIFGGRIADFYGRRRTLLGGLVLFSLASLVAGLSQSGPMLIILRGVQGLGAAIIAPSALSLLTTTFTAPAARQRALSAWGAVLGGGFVSGVILGGVITQYLGWRWVLLVNAPIAAGLAVLCPFMLPSGAASGPRRRLDVRGAFLVTAGVSAIVYAISEAGAAGWWSGQTLGVLAGGIALLAAFVLAEAHNSEPLIPLGIFRLRPVVVSNSANVLLMGAYVGVVFVLTLFLQDVHGFNPLQTGLSFALAGVAGLAGGSLAGKLAGRAGIRTILVGAGIIQAAATMLLFTLPHTHTVLLVVVGTVVLNFSDVVAIVMINIGATSGLPDDSQGLAGGLVTATQQVGAAIGLAVIAAVVSAQTGVAGHTATGSPNVAALLHGYRWGLAVSAAMSVAGALLVLATLRSAAPAPAGGDTAQPDGVAPAPAAVSPDVSVHQ